MLKMVLTKAEVTVSQAPATPHCDAEAELSADSDSITLSSIYSLSEHQLNEPVASFSSGLCHVIVVRCQADKVL